MAFYQPPAAPAVATPASRAAAWILDLIILITVGFSAITAAGWSLDSLEALLGSFVFEALYYIVPTALFGGTPGKRFLKMRVIRADGDPIQPDAAILRYLVYLLSNLIPFGLMLSMALILTDPERRTLHNLAANTLVI